MSDEGRGPLGFGDDAEDAAKPDAGEASAAPRSAPAPEEAPAKPAHDPERYAHRRDPDLAAYGIGPGASRDRPPPARLPVNTSRYTWFVGVLAIVLIAYVTVNSVTTKGRGAHGLPIGSQAPPFAAPFATSDRFKADADVNLARKSGGDADKEGNRAACSIHRADVLTSCDLWASKPAVIAFFAPREDECTRQLDVLQRRVRRRGDVNLAAIAISHSRDDVRRTITSHGWTFPVGYDHDNGLSSVYGVVVCPAVTFVRKGGRVAGVTVGDTTDASLLARVDALAARRVLPEDARK